ncbi:MAG: biopolymer transporter ExbD [candidate division Zixibacteria bacterium]|nr:biopolymer transporter ExbD [candidate division Zixibacteria bacterium]
MGAVDLGGPQSKGKKRGLRRPQRRLGVRIDMTPMVDIAFLLLIFYMVATIFAEPQAMEINLPPSKTETKTKESKVLTLRVDAKDRIFWNVAQDKPEPVDLADLPKLLHDKVFEIPELVTLVKISKSARYSRMIEILDRIEIVEYRFKEGQKAAIKAGTRPADEPEFSYVFSLAPWTRLDTKTIASVTGETEPSDDTGTP